MVLVLWCCCAAATTFDSSTAPVAEILCITCVWFTAKHLRLHNSAKQLWCVTCCILLCCLMVCHFALRFIAICHLIPVLHCMSRRITYNSTLLPSLQQSYELSGSVHHDFGPSDSSVYTATRETEVVRTHDVVCLPSSNWCAHSKQYRQTGNVSRLCQTGSSFRDEMSC